MTQAQKSLTSAKVAVVQARKALEIAKRADAFQRGRGLAAQAQAALTRAEHNAEIALRAVEAERVVSIRRAAEFQRALAQRAA